MAFLLPVGVRASVLITGSDMGGGWSASAAATGDISAGGGSGVGDFLWDSTSMELWLGLLSTEMSLEDPERVAGSPGDAANK